MIKYKLYKVGGCIRDQYLGVKSKDIDYSFVFEEIDPNKTPEEYYKLMRQLLEEDGIKIYTEKPECYTILGRRGDEDVDFVMARKETYPDPTTRIPKVEMGTLYDDLERRDFTINAMAEDDCGNLIDPFNGLKDLNRRILRCPIDAKTSFNDDPLRMLRAIRFAITKNFSISDDIDDVMSQDVAMWDKFKTVVSRERIRDEIYKMMKHDTVKTVRLINDLDMFSNINILERIFENDLWLEPTNKKR